MKLYYNKVLLGNKKTWKGIDKLIAKHLKKINFTSHYQRLWQEGDKLVIDYGSHFNFFNIVLEDGESYNSVIEQIRKLD